MERFFLALLIVGWSIVRVAVAWAESDDQWHGPFGGAFSAYFTAASDYSFAGISQTKLGPAIQAGLDYRTPDLTSAFPVWLYLSAWGSNINFPTTGEGVELDLAAGVKFRALDRKLSVDLGYIRYLYPGIPASYGYEYGEINLNVGYNFGFATLNGRVRYSPNSFSSSGISWNKRALLSVPLPFLRINEDISFRTAARWAICGSMATSPTGCRPTTTGTGRSAWSPAPTASTSPWPTPIPASTRPAAASPTTAPGASSSA